MALWNTIERPGMMFYSQSIWTFRIVLSSDLAFSEDIRSDAPHSAPRRSHRTDYVDNCGRQTRLRIRDGKQPLRSFSGEREEN